MTRSFLVLAPLPPPVHGVTVMTQAVVETVGAMTDLRVEQQWSGGASRLEDVGRNSYSKTAQFLQFIFALLLRGLTQAKVDVAYVTMAPWAATALRDAMLAACAKRLSRRTLVHVHGEGLEALLNGHSLRARLIRRMIGGTELIAITSRSRDIGDRSELFSRTWMLHNVAPDPGPATREHATNSPLVCGMLGNLDPRKGVLQFVDVVAAARSSGVRIEGKVAGGGTPQMCSEHLRTVIHAKGLDGLVTLDGPLYGEDKKQFLRRLDVFLYLSRHDHAPLVLIEAMSNGAVPIVLDTGGIAEIVGTALDFNVLHRNLDGPDLVDEIVQRLKVYASNPEALTADRTAARRRYLEVYTPNTFAAALASIIKDERT